MTNNLSRIAIIARHEFLAIAGKKSFIVMTILVPLISLACIGLPYVMMQFNKGDVETVAVVDESGRYGKAITDNDEFRFHDITPIASDGGGELHEFYQQQDGLYAIVIIPADVDSSLTVDIFSENAVRMGLQRHVAQCLGDTITQSRIASYHIPQLDKIIADSHVEVSPNCVKWSDDGEESRSDAELASVIGLILAFLTYMFVMMYGAMILTSVVEEKTNRIIGLGGFQPRLAGATGTNCQYPRHRHRRHCRHHLAVVGLDKSRRHRHLLCAILHRRLPALRVDVCRSRFHRRSAKRGQPGNGADDDVPCARIVGRDSLHGQSRWRTGMVVLDDTVHLAGGDDGAPALRRAPVGNSPEHRHPARFRPGHSLRGCKNLPQGHPAIRQEILLEEHRRLAKITTAEHLFYKIIIKDIQHSSFIFILLFHCIGFHRLIAFLTLY